MTLAELQDRAITAMQAYATTTGEYGPQAEDFARKLHAYRRAQAEQMTVLAADTETKRTDKVKEALVDKATEMLMLERNLAEARLNTTKIRIDQLKTEISLLQSLLRLETADRDMTRFNQQGGA